MVGVHADTVGRWLKLDKKSLALQRSGRKKGDGCFLNPEQAERIRRLLIDRTPDQLKMAYALWTRQAVRELIVNETGVELAIRTVGEYLKRWGHDAAEAAETCLRAARPGSEALAGRGIPGDSGAGETGGCRDLLGRRNGATQ